MARFYLLRHGETEWNREGNRYCGRSDIILSAVGRKQAQRAKDALEEISFDAAYSSPLQRSNITAQVIAEPHNLSVKEDSRLLEIDFGQWEGLTKDEILTAYPEQWENWLQDPTHSRAGENGETAREVYQRAYDFFEKQSQLYAGKNVLVVGHNTLNRLLICGSLEIPFRQYRRFIQSNTGITILEWSASGVNWVQMNETAHLRNLGSDTL